jgi:hypothetical protein
MDTFKRIFASIDIQIIDRFPARECGKQPAQSQYVVQVTVGDQDVIQIFKSQPGLQYLALGALATIDEKAILIMFKHLGGKPAPNRGGGC